MKHEPIREAVRQYRELIEDGFNMGRREDLTGGGLRRSAGGWGKEFGRNWPGISVYPGLQSRRPSSKVKNLRKRMMLNY